MFVPRPTVMEVEKYLQEWANLESYKLQETALDRLFFELSPKNTDISDILLKVATLNDFYSTNIFSIFPVAKHILSLDIDERLKRGDIFLVNEIQNITIKVYEFLKGQRIHFHFYIPSGQVGGILRRQKIGVRSCNINIAVKIYAKGINCIFPLMNSLQFIKKQISSLIL